MINREITYERTVSSNYMKIPSVMEACFDEKMILRKAYTGCIGMEKCFVNGQGQYWYNITGKQGLDSYCRVNTVNFAFFETLLLRICNQLEVLEWNLIDSNCLMVDPELIFLNNRGEDISFVLYPDRKTDFFADFQQLMEYLLTKLNHGEKEAVHTAYKIYEITLSNSYDMSEIKEAILARKQKDERKENLKEIKKIPIVSKEATKTAERCQKENTDTQHFLKEDRKIQKSSDNKKNLNFIENLKNKTMELLERTKKILSAKPEDIFAKNRNIIPKKEEAKVVYPDEEEQKEELEIHPTVCLTGVFGEARGILLYEGMENYTDFDLQQESCLIGKNNRVRMHIEKDTISQVHARIDYIENYYYIEDLNSTNGTYVNDEILNYKERKVLQSGDSVRFADVKYRFL